MPIYFFLLILLLSCQPNSLDDFQSEGASLAKSLVVDLRQIDSKEIFVETAPKVKRKIQKLTELMILAAKYQSKHLGDSGLKENSDHYYSDLLLEEFKRVYAIQGCKEIMEGLQRDSLHQLDAYLKSVQDPLNSRYD
jgi:hypothetical protein